MTDIRFEKSGNLGMLSFHGELTASYAGKLKEALMASLSNAENVVVNFTKVTKIDFICLHLITLAYRKAEQLRKHLILSDIGPEIYRLTKLNALKTMVFSK